MKKHIMLLALMVLAFFLSHAQAALNYPWLTFTLTDNSEVSVPSENLQITYDESNLKLSSETVHQTLPLSSLKSMRFESIQSGIECAEATANPIVQVFNPQGINVGVFTSIAEAVCNLPHGTYIIRGNKISKKVMF